VAQAHPEPGRAALAASERAALAGVFRWAAGQVEAHAGAAAAGGLPLSLPLLLLLLAAAAAAAACTQLHRCRFSWSLALELPAALPQATCWL
jgi:hypothetical protein